MKEAASQSNLLSGLKALDLSSSMGAFCGKLLRDLGMEVVKVEPPEGDQLRTEPPFAGKVSRETSLRFAYLNGGKKGVTLDLTKPTGRNLFLDLVQTADVVLETFQPGTLERLQLSYDALKERQPKLILASLSGFGQSGPYKDYLAPDIVAAAMGGLLYISGDSSLPPCMPPETQSYYYASLFTAFGIMLALWRRETKGFGAHIDASIQASLALHEHVAFTYSLEKRLIKRAGSQHQHVAPANLFPCRDGYISIFINQTHWPIFLKVWENHPPELDDPRWKGNSERRAHADWINALVTSFTERWNKDELSHLLQKSGIPALPVNKPAQFIADPHIQEREFFGPVEHPVLGSHMQPGAPLKIDGQRQPPGPAPLLGQHNQEVYGELGLDRHALAVLAADGVI